MTDAHTADHILAALKERHSGREWAFFPELRLGTGYGVDAEQRIDAYVVGMWKDLIRIAYEIKVSRSDFLHEIKHPNKARRALAFSNRYFFATPVGLVKPEELPPWAGLIEVMGNPEYTTANHWHAKYLCNKVIDAPLRESIRPTWRFVAALSRRIVREEAKCQET